jgi:FAD dependent oxidoreductase TIGR03364
MQKKYDLIIVGGGVLGTFHAYHALELGLKVALIEKDLQPQSATVRNFGQVVPSGMNTKWQNYGRKSLSYYNQIQSKFDITVRNNGSIYFASNTEEVQLLEELAQINKANGYSSELLTKQTCIDKYPGLKSNYVMAGLYFPEELTVEPRTMIHQLLEYLQREKKLEYFPSTQVLNCTALSHQVELNTANGQLFFAEKVIICSGSEFKTLYPQLFQTSDLEVTKLQMLQTVPQENFQLKGSILTGLSIRRYEAFHECNSYKKIKDREDVDSFAKKWGVHILFKQALDGSIIIGDSHQYADASNMDSLGFDLQDDIESFMIEEAKKIFELPNYTIRNRWFGIYSQCKNHDIFEHTIDTNIHIVTGIGGKGMTGSAGYAKENIDKIYNRN